MYRKLNLGIILLIVNFLVIGSFALMPVNAQDEELDTSLLEDHEGGLVDYTEMYGLERDEQDSITYNSSLRSSTIQENNYIAILVEFPDMTSTDLDDASTLNKANALMNTGNASMQIPIGQVPVISMKEYVEKYTYNKMTTTTHFFPQNTNGKVVSVMLSNNRGYYMKKSTSNPNGYTASQAAQRERELVNEILTKSKESIERVLSASDIDKNNDGCVDAISFFLEGNKVTEDKVEWSDLLWSHKISGMNLSVKLHNKTVDTYNLINTYDSNSECGVFSLNQGTYGTIIHEYMHILGLPDLYRYNDSGVPVGFYDLMATTTSYSPQGMLAYMTSEYNNLGWNNELQTITNSTTVTLNRPQYTNPSEKRAVKVYSPYNDKEFFVIEYYEKQNNVYPEVTTNSDGLVVYRINTGVNEADGNVSGTSTGLKDYLYVFRPGETGLGKGGGDLNNAVLTKNSRSTFGKAIGTTSGWDNNTLFYSDGSNSGIVINVTGSDSNSITFNVTVPGSTVPITGVSLNKTAVTLAPNQTETLQATILPTNTTESKTLTWTTSNSSVATVSAGRVTAKSAGTATITVRTSNGKTASCRVTVSNDIPITSVSLNKTTVTLIPNQTETLQATILPSNTTESKTLTWTTSNSSVATVSAGRVTAKSAGTATITVRTSNGKTASCRVTVSKPSVTYQTHIEDIGWQDLRSNGTTSGTTMQSKRLEAIRINITNNIEGIQYRSHIQDIGWQSWQSNGAISGTSGQSKRLEAIEIKLIGQMANYYDIYYRVHAQEFGWLDWAKNGESAGTAGYSYRLEAIQIVLVEKGGKAPGATTRPFVQHYVSYSTHVQDIGWQEAKYDGEVSGTSGQSKRIEGITIALENPLYSGSIQYRSHVQDIGWQSWQSNGAISGTVGQSKRLEAIQIRLTGEMANKYDIYYRAHVEDYGWLGWAKNGASAGTIGLSKRLEAIEIKLVEK